MDEKWTKDLEHASPQGPPHRAVSFQNVRSATSRVAGTTAEFRPTGWRQRGATTPRSFRGEKPANSQVSGSSGIDVPPHLRISLSGGLPEIEHVSPKHAVPSGGPPGDRTQNPRIKRTFRRRPLRSVEVHNRSSEACHRPWMCADPVVRRHLYRREVRQLAALVAFGTRRARHAFHQIPPPAADRCWPTSTGGLGRGTWTRMDLPAPDHNRRLTDVARGLISRSLPTQQVIEHAATRKAHQSAEHTGTLKS
jgi:hypothetical protein